MYVSPGENWDNTLCPQLSHIPRMALEFLKGMPGPGCKGSWIICQWPKNRTLLTKRETKQGESLSLCTRTWEKRDFGGFFQTIPVVMNVPLKTHQAKTLPPSHPTWNHPPTKVNINGPIQNDEGCCWQRRFIGLSSPLSHIKWFSR